MIDRAMSTAFYQGDSMKSMAMYQYHQMNNLMQRSSPPPPMNTLWPFSTPPATVKQEVAPPDNNDSGINSASSPGSDHSQDNQLRMMGFDATPLTPPNSEPLVSPKSEEANQRTPSPNAKSEDHLRYLEMSMEKNTTFSSMASEKSLDDESQEGDTGDELYLASLRVPKVNSHGKTKTFRCKHCPFMAITKLEFWEHSRIHIKPEKRLDCPKCPFVTEFKHHLEYHMLNHDGAKPFKCTKCEYTCVNKSMLNSHMKSHSNVYQYRCANCTYATKYCHSLKLHLRKYSHEPAMVLDENGTPNPIPIIDVYGTRRGPKVKSQARKEEVNVPSFTLPAQPLPLVPLPHMFKDMPNPYFLQLLISEQAARMAIANSMDNGVLDLSKPATGEQQKNRRKGPPVKLDRLPKSESEDEEMMGTTTTMFSNVEAVVQPNDDDDDDDGNNNNNEEQVRMEEEESQHTSQPVERKPHICEYCDIAFGDFTLHSIHMGYHGTKDPFVCKSCGVKCQDRITFSLHIARSSHV